ncbi:hypothetical protein EDD99_0274 [Streptomyces sp. 846.5]|nr:hypothetical protein EDD99_0274 [Streptomyces sp. 846.5]
MSAADAQAPVGGPSSVPHLRPAGEPFRVAGRAPVLRGPASSGAHAGPDPRIGLLYYKDADGDESICTATTVDSIVTLYEYVDQ